LGLVLKLCGLGHFISFAQLFLTLACGNISGLCLRSGAPGGNHGCD
jgi:hypothetical protein